jgi:hypothetical protein
MHGSMHVSGALLLEKPRGTGGGVLVFEGGVIAPPVGVGFALPPPASLPAAVRLNDLRIVLPASTKVQFPCPFPAKRGA